MENWVKNTEHFLNPPPPPRRRRPDPGLQTLHFGLTRGMGGGLHDPPKVPPPPPLGVTSHTAAPSMAVPPRQRMASGGPGDGPALRPGGFMYDAVNSEPNCSPYKRTRSAAQHRKGWSLVSALLSLFITVAPFAVCVSLELLKIGVACKLNTASHAGPGFFIARWN